MDNGFHKSVASSETDTSKKQRDADFPYHQIGTHSGISNQLILRAETADKNRNNQRASCQPEFNRLGNSGKHKRDATQDTSQGNTQKNRNQIRMIQAFHRITQYLFCMTHRQLTADNRHTVSHL